MWPSHLKGVGTIFLLGNPFEFRLPDPIEGIKLKMLDLGLKNTDLRLALQSKSGGDSILIKWVVYFGRTSFSLPPSPVVTILMRVDSLMSEASFSMREM